MTQRLETILARIGTDFVLKEKDRRILDLAASTASSPATLRNAALRDAKPVTGSPATKPR
jgi:hypothetical protein